MGRKSKKSDDSDGGGEEGCELASQSSNNSVGNQALSLSDIQKLLTGMEERIIGSLTAQITSNHAAIIRHDETIQAIETSMNDFQGRITTVESTLADIMQENKQLKLKVDDLENRSRRCNIRITGIPERAEGARPTTFIESFLAEIFGPDAFPRPLTVDRAHRLAVQRRQRIMQLAREKGPLMYRGAEINIYADYSAEVARKRDAFTPIKSSLRNPGLAFSLLFPAKLWVVVDGTRHEFNSPAEAAAFLKRRQPAAN
ncbi:LINE-1 retrotransposable element ORF1 protein [Dissostichus eleginoides]|uniref:LINE-1 retrotransposable element ORF1 protein n=1 Tax=Dissostichus eleginoides TaxID=100907 RepID=A0AAD9F9H0_DISEL|nr:LINE-1 retrotransposable element ORF1 protein [Dissostichus eleginoides]